jgi:prepilin-type N-terminal cleavage/methylation domain-containing protein
MIIEESIEIEEKDQGFTLVELLIVIVILGILATIVVFAVRGITDQGQQSSCKATAKTYEVAIEAYYAQYGNSVNPSGAQLVSANLLRSYNATGGVAINAAVSPSSISFSGKCASTVI